MSFPDDPCVCCGEPNEDTIYQDAAGNAVCGWCLLAHWNAALEVEELDGMKATTKAQRGG